MSHLVRVPIDILRLPDELAEDRESRFIRDDLQAYCSLLDSLPIVWAVIGERDITIASGIKYAIVARDLGQTHLSLLVPGELTSADLDHLSDVGATVSDVPREPADVGPRETERSWHLIGFDGAPSPSERDEFRAVMRALFKTPEQGDPIEVEFVGGLGRTARFQAMTPSADRGFAIALLATLRRFHESTRRILSYQGQRFSGYLPDAMHGIPQGE